VAFSRSFFVFHFKTSAVATSEKDQQPLENDRLRTSNIVYREVF
jgi:hypothetical protein